MTNTVNKGTRLALVGGSLILLAAAVVVTLWLLRGGDSKPDDGKLVLPGRDKKTPVERPGDPRLKLVQPAIDKGVAFLRSALKKKEGWVNEFRIGAATPFGISGLVGLTLLECGVPADDPDILAIASELRKAAPTMNRTYVISAMLFFFNRWNEARPLDDADRKLARSLGLRLCAGQMDIGIWNYDCPTLNEMEEQELLSRLEKGDLPPGRPYASYSVSNSQFAMLALWGARKHGIPVRDVLLRAAGHFHRTQFADGYWQYNVEIDPTVLWTTATAAGLMALAMDKALREDREFNLPGKEIKEPGKRADVAKAFAYVARSIGRKKGDPGAATHRYAGTIFHADAWGDLYCLWTIERLGMIYGLPMIEGKDWYDWGYPIILENQNKDGSWQDRFQPEVDTCFALLFLKRANLAQDLSDKLQELMGTTGRRKD